MIFPCRVLAIIFHVCHQEERMAECSMARRNVWAHNPINILQSGTDRMVFPDRNTNPYAISKKDAQSAYLRDTADAHNLWGHYLCRQRPDYRKNILQSWTFQNDCRSDRKSERKTTPRTRSRNSLTSFFSTCK